FVPTAQMLAGDFTTFASAACNSSGQINLPAPFAGNRVSPTLFSKAALAVVSYLPKSDDPCGRVNFGATIISNVYQILARMGCERGSKPTTFGRSMATKNFQPAPVTVSSSALGSTSGGHDQLAQSFTLGDTYLLSATTINSFRLAFNRTASHTLGGEFFSG